MNAFIFGIIIPVFMVNLLSYPLSVLVFGAIAFVNRTPYDNPIDEFQDDKYRHVKAKLLLCDDDEGLFSILNNLAVWFVFDLFLGFLLLGFLAWLGSMGILWVPVFAVAILFGLRAYIDRYGKEWKVKL